MRRGSWQGHGVLAYDQPGTLAGQVPRTGRAARSPWTTSSGRYFITVGLANQYGDDRVHAVFQPFRAELKRADLATRGKLDLFLLLVRQFDANASVILFHGVFSRLGESQVATRARQPLPVLTTGLQWPRPRRSSP